MSCCHPAGNCAPAAQPAAPGLVAPSQGPHVATSPGTVPLCPDICPAVTDRWPDPGTCHRVPGASDVQTASAARPG